MTDDKEKREALAQYDAGLLNDFGGGNVGWWHDYLRAELNRAHEHYDAELAALRQALVDTERCRTRWMSDCAKMESERDALREQLDSACERAADIEGKLQDKFRINEDLRDENSRLTKLCEEQRAEGQSVLSEWSREREAQSSKVEKLCTMLHEVLPLNMGGTPDLFFPKGGWDAWEDDATKVLHEIYATHDAKGETR
jgi:hypothetical protein